MGTHFAMQAKAILVASAAAVLVIIGMVAFMAPSSQSVSPLGHTSVTPATKMFSIFNIGGSTCTTVSSLDIDQFAGNWYQVINNGYTEIFGGGTSCTGTVTPRPATQPSLSRTVTRTTATPRMQPRAHALNSRASSTEPPRSRTLRSQGSSPSRCTLHSSSDSASPPLEATGSASSVRS